MNELALFAGVGGGILAGKLLGWRTRCAVEIDAYCREVLLAKQRDGFLEPFPVWDDVTTFDGRPWRGSIDVVSGGFPCQDISITGSGKGLAGDRSGLWTDFARIIGEVQPRYAFVENSPMLVRRGLGRVLGDLSCMGYDARWGIISASEVGAPHNRERLWIVAIPDPDRIRCESPPEQPEEYGEVRAATVSAKAFVPVRGSLWDESKLPAMGLADGIPTRLEPVKACGNAQVPICAATAFRLLANREPASAECDGR